GVSGADTFVRTAVSAVIETTEIGARISAYSTSAWPSSRSRIDATHVCSPTYLCSISPLRLPPGDPAPRERLPRPRGRSHLRSTVCPNAAERDTRKGCAD